MKKTYIITLSQTANFAKEIAKQLKGGEILALVGPLGSGKTAFTKALGKALKVRGNIASPTFILMNVFSAKISSKLRQKNIYLYHLDLYRAKTFREVKALGLMEIWGKPNVVTVIEWADKIRKYLPKKSVYINFIRDLGAKEHL